MLNDRYKNNTKLYKHQISLCVSKLFIHSQSVCSAHYTVRTDLFHNLGSRMLNWIVVTVELNKRTLHKIRVIDFKESGICVFVRGGQRHRKHCTWLSASLDKTKVDSLFCCFTVHFLTHSVTITQCFKGIQREPITVPVAIRVQIADPWEVTFLYTGRSQ